jgi:peptide deformylase
VANFLQKGYNAGMTLKILKFPDPLLRRQAKAVKKITPAIVALIDKMIATMHAAPGVGLAAPQVGRSIRVIVADIGEGPIALVNPVILEQAGSQVYTEGCLCLPGVEAPVERAASVKVKGLDRAGQEVIISATELLATVLQHEVDHLEGLVFIDRVKDPSLIRYVPRDKEKKEELL